MIKAVIEGGLTKDAEVSWKEKNGKQYCMTKLVVALNSTDKKGDEHVAFWTVFVFGWKAERVESLRKGDRVLCSGNVSFSGFRKQDGQEKTCYTLFADSVAIVPKSEHFTENNGVIYDTLTDIQYEEDYQ